jgi:hypothetical protein
LTTLFALAWLSAISSAVAAQSADKIIKRAAKAMGGEKALRRITSWQARGRLIRQSDGATGQFEAATMSPDLYFLGIEIGGFEASAGFNGKSGWRRDSRQGLRTLTGSESADFRAEAAYRNHRWLDYRKDKSKLAYAGQTTVSGKPAHALLLTTVRNVKIKMYFDAASGLLLKEELPAGDGVQSFEYADFRAINGVVEPFAVTISDGEERFQIALDQIVHNQPLARARFNFPKFSDEPLPGIPALLKEVSDNQEEIEKLLEKYTYTAAITSREFNQHGTLKEKESETYELTFYRGHRIRRLVEKNGKPLSAEELAKEDRRIEKQIREIEKRETEKERKQREAAEKGKPESDDENRMTIADVLRASKLTNPRRERFRSREVIVFDFEPNPGYKPKKNVEKIMQKFSGAMWVDASARQVVRVEARLVDSFKLGGGMLASIKPGGGFLLEQDRINNEIWLPTYAEFNFSARLLLLAGLSLNQTIKYDNYKRFNVEAEKEKLKDPIKPER